MPRPVFRFAPSPNGELHLGHALSALLTFERARAVGGRFLVRIEDIDVGRTRSSFIAGIFEDLTWLGLSWEQPVLQQSHRLGAYAAAAQRLAAMGLLYPCFATRAEITGAAGDGVCDPDGAPLYPGLYRHASAETVARPPVRPSPCASTWSGRWRRPRPNLAAPHSRSPNAMRRAPRTLSRRAP